MTHYHIAQIISVITMITTVFGLLSKEKHKIMLWFFLSNITLLITYFLLGRLLGSVLVAGAAIRTLVYYYYSRKNLKPSVVVMLFFEVYFIAISLFLWKDFVDLFMLLNLSLLTYTTWQNNMKTLRIGYILSSILLITFNILVGAHVNIITELVMLISTIYGMYKYNIYNKIDNVVLHFYSTIKDSYEINIDKKENVSLVTSKKIKDIFNNFVFVENSKSFNSEVFKKEHGNFLNALNEQERVQSVYFFDQNHKNINTIYSQNKQYQLLYHDVWMKLRTGHNTKKISPLLENVTFKEGEFSDGKEIVEVFKKGFINIVGNNFYKYDKEYVDIYNEKYLTPNNLKNSVPYVAYYNNKIIAILSAYLSGTNAYLCQITTLPEHRRKGVASALIQYAINNLRYKFGVEDFYLVTEKYTILETFYLKNNFEEVAQGLCFSYEKTKPNIIHTQEGLASKQYSNTGVVVVPIEEYKQFVIWRNQNNENNNTH